MLIISRRKDLCTVHMNSRYFRTNGLCSVKVNSVAINISFAICLLVDSRIMMARERGRTYIGNVCNVQLDVTLEHFRACIIYNYYNFLYLYCR